MRYAIAVIVGVTCGLGLFFAADALIPTPPVEWRDRDRQYSGIVSSQNEKEQWIRISVKSAFPGEEPGGVVQFAYDSTTQWFSLEYTFKDGVLAKEYARSEKPRTLPAGTLASVYRDHDSDMPFRAMSIVFLRKTEL